MQNFRPFSYPGQSSVRPIPASFPRGPRAPRVRGATLVVVAHVAVVVVLSRGVAPFNIAGGTPQVSRCDFRHKARAHAAFARSDV